MVDHELAALDTLSALTAQVDGEVVTPRHPDFEVARRVWNGIHDRRPQVIVRCASTADVSLGVAFARTHGLPLAVRGGGHGVAGHGTVDGGVVLDLSGMSSISVDDQARQVTVGGGATWGEVDAVTQAAGLAVPGGVFSRTGVAGLALAGGYGWLRNAYGLSCASLVAAEVVTAQSEVVQASATENPELLWALRGGGGNVGVVTSFTFRAHPVDPEVYFLMVHHDASDGGGARALRSFRDFCAGAPHSTSLMAFAGVVPEGAHGFVPGSAGRPFVAFAGMVLGDPVEGERLLRPLHELGVPLADASGVMPYVEVQRAFDEEYPDGMRYYWKSVNVTDLGDAAIEAIAAAGRAPASDLSTIDVWHVAGAAAEPVDGAFATSSAAFLVNPEANWVDAADDDANIAWTRSLVSTLEPFSDGTRYLNFAGFQEEGADLVRASFGDRYERLTAVKAQWDPENLFRLNPNVRPQA